MWGVKWSRVSFIDYFLKQKIVEGFLKKIWKQQISEKK